MIEPSLDTGVRADVTVIIPAYRAAATLERALRSVGGQTLKPRAVVLVDDGSPDDTAAVAERCRAYLRGIDYTIIRQANAGPGAARNRALAEAKTTYVAFLDADDEWMADKLMRTMSHFDGDDLVLVGHDSIEVDGNTQKRLACAEKFLRYGTTPYAALYRRGFIDTTTVVARLDVIREVGGFDITLPNAQDFELWLAILARPSHRYLIFGEILSRYHRQAGSVMAHVERRRVCCMLIARRYARVLGRHPGSALASLWFRVAAIHREALAAHVAAQQWGSALRAIALLPIGWIWATLDYLGGRTPPRNTFLT